VLLVQPGPCSEKLWFKNRSEWGARTFYGVNQNKKKTKNKKNEIKSKGGKYEKLERNRGMS
jgi:hypothetical protein